MARTAIYSAAIIGVLAILTFSAMARADEPVVRIRFGSNYRDYSMEETQRRVWELERAVAELQQRIFHLERQPPVVVQPEKPWTCLLSNNMKGTFTSTKATRGEATAHVLKQCEDPFWCKAQDVSCSQ